MKLELTEAQVDTILGAARAADSGAMWGTLAGTNLEKFLDVMAKDESFGPVFTLAGALAVMLKRIGYYGPPPDPDGDDPLFRPLFPK